MPLNRSCRNVLLLLSLQVKKLAAAGIGRGNFSGHLRNLRETRLIRCIAKAFSSVNAGEDTRVLRIARKNCHAHGIDGVQKRLHYFVARNPRLSQGLCGVLAIVCCGAVIAGASAAKPPTLAVLPFVPMTSGAKSLAERMRFAVAQKMSRDGHYRRVDDHDVDMMIDALQLTWAPPVTTHDIQTVIKSLATDQTVAGFVTGRRLTLEWFVGTKLTKTVAATIPPNNTSPRLTIEKMLTALAAVQFHHVRSWQIDPSAALKKLFNRRPNLVKDPDFSQAAQSGGIARDWDVFLFKQDYHPPLYAVGGAKTLPANHAGIVPQGVVTPGGKGYCLMLRTNLENAQNNGLACESTWIPVIQGHRYRLEVQYHSAAPRIRIFINGFAFSPDQFSKANNPASQRREIYRCQVLPVNKNTGWSRTGIDFTPESLKGMRKKYPIRWVRIDFYSYLNAGEAFVRDVELKDITAQGYGVK